MYLFSHIIWNCVFFVISERLKECIRRSYFSRIGTAWAGEEEEMYASVRWQGIAIDGTPDFKTTVVPGDSLVCSILCIK